MSMQKTLLHAVLTLSHSHKVEVVHSVTDTRVTGELVYSDVTLQEVAGIRLGLALYNARLDIWLNESSSLCFSLEPNIDD